MARRGLEDTVQATGYGGCVVGIAHLPLFLILICDLVKSIRDGF
jgi:hypothetical protein